MARNLRWTMNFESLHGVQCLVKIFDSDGWSGTPTALTPGDNPFSYEEDDDEDMTKLIRYKTGTLRVFVGEGEHILDLYPSTFHEHYVEFYYGETLDFIGFIQPQSFEEEWSASARVSELQVVSPLGLAESINFSVTGPWYKKLGTLLFGNLLPLLHANVNEVVAPHPGTQFFTEGLIDSCVMLTEKQNPTSSVLKDHVESKTLDHLLEGICALLGCVLHEEPNRLIFARPDYNGQYAVAIKTSIMGSYRVENLTTTGEDHLTPLEGGEINDEAAISSVMPVSRVKLSDDVDHPNITLPFANCYRIYTSYDGTIEVVGNYPVGANGVDYNAEWTSPYLLQAGTYKIDSSNRLINSSGAVITEGVVFAGIFNTQDETPTAKEMVVMVVSGSAHTMKKMMSYVVHSASWAGSKIKVEGVSASNLKDLLNASSMDGTMRMQIRDYQGQYLKYDSSNDRYYWDTDSSTYIVIDDKVEVGLPIAMPGPFYIDIWVRTGQSFSSSRYYGLKEFNISVVDDAWHDYVFGKDEGDRYMPSLYNDVDPSFEDADITLNISNNINSPNYVNYLGLTAYDGLKRLIDQKYYTYMRRTQTRIVLPLRGTVDGDKYLPQYFLTGFDYPFRLISRSFNPAEDEHTLTLHGNMYFDEDNATPT